MLSNSSFKIYGWFEKIQIIRFRRENLLPQQTILTRHEVQFPNHFWAQGKDFHAGERANIHHIGEYQDNLRFEGLDSRQTWWYVEYLKMNRILAPQNMPKYLLQEFELSEDEWVIRIRLYLDENATLTFQINTVFPWNSAWSWYDVKCFVTNSINAKAEWFADRIIFSTFPSKCLTKTEPASRNTAILSSSKGHTTPLLDRKIFSTVGRSIFARNSASSRGSASGPSIALCKAAQRDQYPVWNVPVGHSTWKYSSLPDWALFRGQKLKFNVSMRKILIACCKNRLCNKFMINLITIATHLNPW